MSVIRANERYYSQTHLEECKYKITRNRVENLISDDLDSMKNLCLDLREHATKLINYEKKEMIPLMIPLMIP